MTCDIPSISVMNDFETRREETRREVLSNLVNFLFTQVTPLPKEKKIKPLKYQVKLEDVCVI